MLSNLDVLLRKEYTRIVRRMKGRKKGWKDGRMEGRKDGKKRQGNIADFAEAVQESRGETPLKEQYLKLMISFS